MYLSCQMVFASTSVSHTSQGEGADRAASSSSLGCTSATWSTPTTPTEPLLRRACKESTACPYSGTHVVPSSSASTIARVVVVVAPEFEARVIFHVRRLEEHLKDIAAGEWVDPNALAGEVANMHDAARMLTVMQIDGLSK